jgi:hypothetical protein
MNITCTPGWFEARQLDIKCAELSSSSRSRWNLVKRVHGRITFEQWEVEEQRIRDSFRQELKEIFERHKPMHCG